MTPKQPRSHHRSAIDPRTGRHIAAPDSLWWTCTWIAAVVLSAPLFAWAAYTFWRGEFYLPRTRHTWTPSGFVVVKGVSAALLSTTVFIAGVGVFARIGVREVDALKPLIDRVEPLFIAAGFILVLAVALLPIGQWW